jgi:serine phosphatase RsbU (regulator of sigma subunit)
MDASNPVASILAQGDSLKAMLDMSRRLQLVYEVGEAISTTLNEQKLVSVIMDKLLEVFPQAERGFIMFYSPEKNQLTARVARTRTGKATEITVSRHLIREVIAKRKGILSADAMGDDRFRAEVSVYQYGIRSVICVPMLAKGEVIGIIHVDASDPTRSFVKDDMALLLGIAGQAALAISNVRLHQRLVHQELIEQDLALAHRIQQRFLPRSPPLLEGYHFHASYSAAQEVGGDYYDFIELPDRHYGIVIGDVSGKGVSAALYMARLSSDVRYHAAGHTEPAEILERLSHVMRSESEENMLVTMLFLSLNVATAELKISNAGHHPPVVRRANGEVFSRHGALNPPLGFEASEAFEQEAMQLEPGDSIVLFTDGVTEAMNAKHEMYDMERLLQVIRGSAGEPAELAGSIARSVKSFIRDAPQSDDITLVCFGRKQEPG